MILRLISLLPPGFIRFLGRLQFKIPILRRIFSRMTDRICANEGTIKHGLGAGLRFNATGGNPGYLLGTTEVEEQDVLGRHLKEGMVFYDLGANIGFYSSIAARIVGSRGHVYAFEPFPVSASAARLNAKINNFDNIDVIEAAVSNKAGTVSFQLGEALRDHKISDTQGELQVPCISLDSYIEESKLRLPDVMMIDIEGAEIDALIGMKETLRASHPVILCEVHWLGERFHDFVKSELEPLGYTVTTYKGERIPQGYERYHVLMLPKEVQSISDVKSDIGNLSGKADL